MKRILFISTLLAALACGAFAQETTPEKKTPDPSLKAAGESLCAAGLKGDSDSLLNFILHPAMMQKAAELAGFENADQMYEAFRTEMQQAIKENPMLECRIDEAYIIECPDFAIKYFDAVGLKVRKCGMIEMTSNFGQGLIIADEITAGMIDGKWYGIVEGILDARDSGETDPELINFASSICAAMENKDPAAMEKLRMAGIKATDPVDDEDLYNWDNYMSHLMNSWTMNVEPVSCSVATAVSFGECTGGTKEAYGTVGILAENCGVIELSVFMDKDIWSNSLSAVFVDGAWHIDPNELIELSRVKE